MKLIHREKDPNSPGILRLMVEIEPGWLDWFLGKPPVRRVYVGNSQSWHDERTGERPSKSFEKRLRALNAAFERKRLKKLLPPKDKAKNKQWDRF